MSCNAFQQIREDLRKKRYKHATDLSHSERVFMGRELSRLPVRFFSVVSNKQTLEAYSSQIDFCPNKFYNKCAQYLLEQVCAYIGPRLGSPDDLRVVFEECNHDYDTMIRFLQKIKEKPLYPQSKHLKHLNPFAITRAKKGSNEMLDIADFVCHAVYQCVNQTPANFRIPEPRYLKEISSRFAGNHQNLALGTGLKCIHSIDSLRLVPEVAHLFRKMSVSPPPAKTFTKITSLPRQSPRFVRWRQ